MIISWMFLRVVEDCKNIFWTFNAFQWIAWDYFSHFRGIQPSHRVISVSVMASTEAEKLGCDEWVQLTMMEDWQYCHWSQMRRGPRLFGQPLFSPSGVCFCCPTLISFNVASSANELSLALVATLSLGTLTTRYDPSHGGQPPQVGWSN